MGAEDFQLVSCIMTNDAGVALGIKGDQWTCRCFYTPSLSGFQPWNSRHLVILKSIDWLPRDDHRTHISLPVYHLLYFLLFDLLYLSA